jgi:hypothetical protein
MINLLVQLNKLPEAVYIPDSTVKYDQEEGVDVALPHTVNAALQGAMGIHISQPNDISEVDKLDDDDSAEKLKADLVDAHAQVVLTATAVTIIDREDECTFKCYAAREDLDTEVPGDTNSLSNNPANQPDQPMAEPIS